MRTGRLSRRSVIAAATLGILGLWVYDAYVVRPLWRSVRRLGGEVQQTRRQVKLIEQTIAQAAQWRQETQRLMDDVEGVQGTLPTEDELPGVIETISELAGQNGVKLQSILPQRMLQAPPKVAASPVPALYKDIQLQIEALGGYHQLGGFVASLESAGQPIRVRTFRLSANPREARRHNLRITVAGYFSTTPRPTAGSAASASP